MLISPRSKVAAAPKTEHAFFAFVLLNSGFQGLDHGCFVGFLRSDGVPGDVLSVPGVPIELHALHSKYAVKTSQDLPELRWRP
jgi:hypothetical protein